MCNTKNTELIRQQLWCDIVTSNNGELTFDKILAEADKAVAEFDKRFNDKLACQSSISGISIDDVYSQLKEIFKDEFYDVTTIDEKSKGVSRFAGIAKDGKHKTIKVYKNHFSKESAIEEMKIEKVSPIIFDLKRPKAEVDEPEFRI